MHTGAGAKVKHVVGLADGFFVMLHHDHGVALIAQVFQRGQKAAVIALVQPDRGFVQHVKHPGQATTDLAGQPDALAFAAR